MNSRIKTTLAIMLAMTMTFTTAMANDEPDGNKDEALIHLSTTNIPAPNRMIDEPIAMYNTATGTLTITLDATYYSDYVITIEGDYVSMDYYVTSPVVVFPASSLSEVSYIYIDSDDCGTYEGVLDINSFGNTN